MFAAMYNTVLSMLNLSTVMFDINTDIWSVALKGDSSGIVKHKWHSHYCKYFMWLNLHCQKEANWDQVMKVEVCREISAYTCT
jgi:hypothetical protein